MSQNLTKDQIEHFREVSASSDLTCHGAVCVNHHAGLRENYCLQVLTQGCCRLSMCSIRMVLAPSTQLS
jgi:hypothetical protein